MKKVLIFLFAVILLSSCSSTRPFVSEVTKSADMTVEEKLEYYGGKEVSVNLPEMYFDGDEWLERMTEEIEKAEDYILLSTFLGSYCPSLDALYSVLETKAEEGVKIYFIIDGISSLDMTDSRFVMTPLNYLREKGINLLIYSPLSFSHIINPSSLIIRDHRKMMVIDGKSAAIGGMNINYISMGAGDECQRDSMYLFSSPSLSSLFIEEFVRIWNEGSVDKLDKNSFTTYEDQDERYRAWLFNRNVYSGDVSVSGMFAPLIESAEDSIFLCPYLPTIDENMAESLMGAVGRGVNVEVWCSQDSRGYAKAGSAWAVSKLIEDTGVEFHDVTYTPEGELLPMYHMKLMVVDGRYVVVGSCNFNYRTMTLSHEIGLVIDSEEMAEKVKALALESAGEGVLLTPEAAAESKKRDGNWFAYIFSVYGG